MAIFSSNTAPKPRFSFLRGLLWLVVLALIAIGVLAFIRAKRERDANTIEVHIDMSKW